MVNKNVKNDTIIPKPATETQNCPISDDFCIEKIGLDKIFSISKIFIFEIKKKIVYHLK